MAKKDEQQLTFEAAFEELQETLRRLEAGNLPLDEALALYERGQQLAGLCAERLDEAELKISELRLDEE